MNKADYEPQQTQAEQIAERADVNFIKLCTDPESINTACSVEGMRAHHDYPAGPRMGPFTDKQLAFDDDLLKQIGAEFMTILDASDLNSESERHAIVYATHSEIGRIIASYAYPYLMEIATEKAEESLGGIPTGGDE